MTDDMFFNGQPDFKKHRQGQRFREMYRAGLRDAAISKQKEENEQMQLSNMLMAQQLNQSKIELKDLTSELVRRQEDVKAQISMMNNPLVAGMNPLVVGMGGGLPPMQPPVPRGQSYPTNTMPAY